LTMTIQRRGNNTHCKIANDFSSVGNSPNTRLM
jgi:hypothetical protein